MLSLPHRPLVRPPDGPDVLERRPTFTTQQLQRSRSPADESRFLVLANQTRQQTSIPGAPGKLYYSIFAVSGVPACTSRRPGHGIPTEAPDTHGLISGPKNGGPMAAAPGIVTGKGIGH